ncbi:TonB-dependent receptor plug domain-containing protein [Croceicoccus naphthovorans]|uniref:TonB-dependent receptor n=1 Tax=Croceicoccus naphthovorans TaxID=1348774 RepID=A0A0G3XMC6_9SPHN|nr:TonB-dependent receptor [Croceicoccus naphthovorans]AKM11829.1 TonB-dependent receptor [Croceicoccus naphthovorans]MBB3991838.1 outer membrane receptor protein involved in Fe transport [Croceicoccus naphthovorans]
MTGRRFLIATLAASAALTAVPAYAQTSEQIGLTQYGEPIFVEGEGLPDTEGSEAYDVTELDREDLIATGSGRIEDALSNIAGFQQFRRSDSRSSNPSAQGATLRALGGNATSRALILLDGVPMSDPFFGYIPFSAIAPERLDSARVTRGGGSGPFGAGALAGTIELTSGDPQSLGAFSGHALINDREETEMTGTLAARLGSGFALVSGRWDRGKGFYTTPGDQRVPATARARYDSWSTQLRGVAPISDTVEAQANVLLFNDNRTLRFDGANSSSEGQDASLRFVGRGDWAFDLLGYVQARNFTNVVISSTRFVPVLDQSNTPSTGLGGKFEIRPPVGDAHTLRLGVDYRKSDGELFETAISAFTGAVTSRRNAGGTNTDLGLFAENDFKLGALTLTAGARADRYTIRDGFYIARAADGALQEETYYDNQSDWRGSFRGGLVYDVSDRLSLRAAAYTGLRLPTLNELYRPFVVFPVTTKANAELTPEKLEGYEAGIDLTAGEGVTLSLTAIDNKVKDAVANVTLDDVTRQRQNIDAIHARGIELSAGIERGIVRFNGSLAYTDAEAQQEGADFDGFRPAQTPKWVAGATLALEPAEGWLLSATVRHVGRQFESDQESDALPAATTIDAYARVPVGDRFAIVLRGENLGDEEIVTRNQGGSVDLGTPRTVWAGIGIGF